MAVYTGSGNEADQRVDKQRILAELRDRYQALKQSWGGYAGYGSAGSPRDLNNAKLVGVSTYYRLAPAFLGVVHARRREFCGILPGGGADWAIAATGTGSAITGVVDSNSPAG